MPVLALLTLLVAGVAAAATHPGDAVAMRSLANTTGAARTLQWGASSPDPCGGTWVGVTCNGERRVTAINASRGGLTGHLGGVGTLWHPLPAPLSMLTSLSELDLSFNALRDDLPVLPRLLGGLHVLDLRSNSFAITNGFFAAFPALETFNLDGNEMSTLKPWIPYDVTSCPGLRSFSAANVHFAGGFPNYFGNATLFPELESLSLARNLLWGETTPEFGKSSKIRFLDVSQQGHDEDARPDDVMQGGLSFVSGMANLVEAHLEGNVFKGPLPDATSLANLRVFDASDNDLCGVAKFPAGVTVNVAGNPGVGTPCPS
uniref:Leucine-rich repeat-containing N-terminal plant-type domain-containing protein n=1 Tax=Oryza meridionalis TaxID=40149 RepID=A0A0E0EYA5_9ORYZ